MERLYRAAVSSVVLLLLAAPGHAQSPPPPVSQPFPGFVSPYEVMRMVHASGFDPLAPPLREGTTYVLRVTDFRGVLMRVVVDGRTGAFREVTRIVPGPGRYGQFYGAPPYGGPAEYDAAMAVPPDAAGESPLARSAAIHPAPAAPPHRPEKPASVDAGVADSATSDATPAPPPMDTPDTDPTRPQVITSSAFTKGGDPLPTLPADSTTRVMRFVFNATTKDSDVLPESLKADDGFVVVQLKQHKTATKEEFDKDRETYLQTLVARKQAEALALYVKRLKDEDKNDIKIDEKYLAEKTGSKDGGTVPVSEDEEEGP